MMRMLAVSIALGAAAPAIAQDEPRFCPNRPDLRTSTCTTDTGRVLVEMSVIDAQIDRHGGERDDLLLAGDLVVRTGVGPSTEVQLGLTGFGRATRQMDGRGETITGVGDIRLGVRQNLLHPDGKGLSIAAEPYVTLPTGRQPIGRDGASLGITLPVEYDIDGTWNVAFTGLASAEKDEDGHGRHAALTGIAGIGYAASDVIDLVGELSVMRDDDPGEPTTQSFAAASIAWRARPLLQLDLLFAAGLNRDTPDARIAMGGALLF